MNIKRIRICSGRQWQGQGLDLIFTDTSNEGPRGLCVRGRRRLHLDTIVGCIEVRAVSPW